MTNEQIDYLISEVDSKIKNNSFIGFGESLEDVLKREQEELSKAIKKYKDFKKFHLEKKAIERNLIDLKECLIKLKI